MSNTTNVTGLNSSLSYHHAHNNVSTQRFSVSADTANNLGYGIGRAVRGAFDSLWSTWQKMWISEPTVGEIAEQRNYMIYEGGLRECVKQLGPALANLQRNPMDRGALNKVGELAAHFARYLKPSDEENLRELQSKMLKPLEERVSATAHLHIKNALSKWMPVFFQGNNPMSEKAQTDLHLAEARRSQVMQEFSGAKTKRFTEHEVDAIAKDASTPQSLGPTQVGTGFTAYVAGGEDTPWEQGSVGSVSAIDTYSNSIIANIRVGTRPIGIVITPDSRYAYVTNMGSNTVSVIDTYNNRVITSVTVGSNPSAIAITSNGQYVYVLNEGIEPTISIIETSNNRVKTTISTCPPPTGGMAASPNGIAIAPNGQFAYTACWPNTALGGINVINTSSNEVIGQVTLGNFPEGIAITPNGLYAYVASYSNNFVNVIKTSSNEVTTKIALVASSYAIAITPNGLYAYVTNRDSNIVSVIETINNTVLTTIGVGSGPSGIAITSDGLYAYVTNAKDNTTSVINTTSNRVVATIALDNSPIGIAITSAKIPHPSGKDIDLIIGLSCGVGGFIILSGVGVYLTTRWLKKEGEGLSESDRLIINQNT